VRTKNRKKSTTILIPIPGLIEIILKWHTHVSNNISPDSPWFAIIKNDWGEKNIQPNPPGKHRQQLLNSRLKILSKRAGIAYKSAHKFRYGHAVYGLKRAQTIADYKAISQSLMHSDIFITDRIYSSLLDNDLKQRLVRLSESKEISKIDLDSTKLEPGLLKKESIDLSNEELLQILMSRLLS